MNDRNTTNRRPLTREEALRLPAEELAKIPLEELDRLGLIVRRPLWLDVLGGVLLGLSFVLLPLLAGWIMRILGMA